jgi:membrane protein YqaA with SNARE-associated domain
LALITTLASVLGGVLGYFLGAWLIDEIRPWLQSMGWQGKYDMAVALYATYGAWALIVKGLTPFPYKIFTITAGAAGMPLLPFIAASLVGRAMRFFLVAGIVRWAGPALSEKLLKYVEWLGWALVIAVAVLAGWLVLR